MTLPPEFLFNRACCRQPLPATILLLSYVMEFLQLISRSGTRSWTGAWSSNDLQWFDFKIGDWDTSPNNSRQGDMCYCMICKSSSLLLVKRQWHRISSIKSHIMVCVICNSKPHLELEDKVNSKRTLILSPRGTVVGYILWIVHCTKLERR